MRTLILASALTVACASELVAQAAPPIRQGSRVRITAPSLGLTKAVGTVEEATGEELVVRFEDPRRVETVDRAHITGMDVRVGEERRRLKGLGVGALIGAGSGVVIGLASGDDEDGLPRFTAGDKAAILGVGLGAVGGLVGLIVGGNWYDVWSPALPAELDLAVLPLMREGGAAVQVSFALRVP